MSSARIAVVIYDRTTRPDLMLAGVAHSLQRRGLRVGGLLQEVKENVASCCATLRLTDILSGRQVNIFEKRGSQARGCRLDLGGLAQAGAWLRAALEARPDVLFVNRFGRQEAEGEGLVDEIAAAVLSEVPVVVAVGAALLPEWNRYAGEEWIDIKCAEDLEAWCLSQAAVGRGSEPRRTRELITA